MFEHAIQRPFLLAILAMAFCAGLGGCGPKRPAVEMVEGVVTLDGAPLSGATVGFSPVGGDGLPAAGMTDSSGKFRLSAAKGAVGGAGTAVGEYVVTISKVESAEPAGPASTDDPNYGKGVAAPAPNEKPKVKFVVPEKYGDAKTSPFRAKVVTGMNAGDGFTFDVKSAGK